MPVRNNQLAKTRTQRAACDRCHELKAKCVASTNRNGPCERCGRLSLDCTYSEKSRMGRPKGQTRGSNRPAATNQSHESQGENPVYYQPSPSPASFSPFADVLSAPDSVSYTELNPERLLSQNHDFDHLATTPFTVALETDGIPAQYLPSIDFGATQTSLFLDNNPLSMAHASESLQPEPGGKTPDWMRFMQDAGNTTSSDLDVGIKDHARSLATVKTDNMPQYNDQVEAEMAKSSTIGQLLHLQSRLHILSASCNGRNFEGAHHTRGETQNGDKQFPNLGEVLAATESLTTVLNELAMAKYKAESVDGSDDDVLMQDAVAYDAADHDLIFLHSLTCYLYLLRILEPFTASLNNSNTKSSTKPQQDVEDNRKSRLSVSLGNFSLASQSQLNARVTTNLIKEMIEELHQSTHCFVLGRQRRNNPDGTDCSIGRNGQAFDGKFSPSPLVHAAKATMRAVHLKETLMLRRLSGGS